MPAALYSRQSRAAASATPQDARTPSTRGGGNASLNMVWRVPGCGAASAEGGGVRLRACARAPAGGRLRALPAQGRAATLHSRVGARVRCHRWRGRHDKHPHTRPPPRPPQEEECLCTKAAGARAALPNRRPAPAAPAFGRAARVHVNARLPRGWWAGRRERMAAARGAGMRPKRRACADLRFVGLATRASGPSRPTAARNDSEYAHGYRQCARSR